MNKPLKHIVHAQRGHNKIFHATPKQIRALRKAYGWTQRDLGVFLCLYWSNRICPTVSRWERGTRKPNLRNRREMTKLVEYNLKKYKRELNKPWKKNGKNSKDISNVRVQAPNLSIIKNSRHIG
jgi:transcriptional regulator with XRE-family HTH domain